MLHEGALTKTVEVLLTGSAEAEAIKLFSNTYLAMRVAFFNELDTYAATRGMEKPGNHYRRVARPAHGNFYNNPSFGYGGYCLQRIRVSFWRTTTMFPRTSSAHR